MSRRLFYEEGLNVGLQSGAAVWAAIDFGSKIEMKGKNILVILPSYGDKYLSEEFDIYYKE